MTNITNYSGLPYQIINALRKDTHHGGFLSASQTTKSPRQFWLTKRHYNEIQVEAVDRIWSLFGTAFHLLMQNGAREEDIVERYYETTLEDEKFSGITDHYSIDGILSDYKVTKTFSIIFKSSYDSWEKQLNCCAYLFRINNHNVNKIRIIAFLKDWSKEKAKFKKDYPSLPIQIIEFPLWTIDEQKRYIVDRIKLFKKFSDTPDDELPLCTEDDRWYSGESWAVMLPGRTSAKRVLDTEDEAKQYCFKNKLKKYEIVRRIGVNRKCEDYCDCKDFCNQYKEKKG